MGWTAIKSPTPSCMTSYRCRIYMAMLPRCVYAGTTTCTGHAQVCHKLFAPADRFSRSSCSTAVLVAYDTLLLAPGSMLFGGVGLCQELGWRCWYVCYNEQKSIIGSGSYIWIGLYMLLLSITQALANVFCWLFCSTPHLDVGSPLQSWAHAAAFCWAFP